MVEIDIKSPKMQSAWGLVGVFTLTIFLSATLLFSVQPLFAKLVLPLLGGSSGVWNTAMVFFQGTLLGGYIYAHLISKYLPFKAQIAVHVLVMAIGLLFLPLSIASGWSPPESGAQSFWLIALFAVSLGVPFFAISANAPLLQRWLSRTDHKDADDPYFLYAASNAGSLISLCAYPFLVEPFTRLQEQTHIWSVGYVILIVGLLMTGFLALRNLDVRPRPNLTRETTAPVKPGQKLSSRQRILWVFLAFIPSSLMLGVTAHITTNVASAPFLWILPLSLYLLTFIVVFAKKPWVTPASLRRIYPIAIVGAMFAGTALKMSDGLSIVLSLIFYFIIALVCHGRLAASRPPANRLTEFYIWMSVGGVMGGIFNALVAPSIFDNVYEYMIVLILAFFAMPPKNDAQLNESRTIALISVSFVAAIMVYATLKFIGTGFQIYTFVSVSVFLVGLAMTRSDKRKSVIDFGALAVGVFMVPFFLPQEILTDRSFFGVTRVSQTESERGIVHKFSHGDTIHNYQYRREDLRKIPLAYYSNGNSFDQALTAARQKNDNLNVAMIGLGAGAMACYEMPGDKWIYYEIDPIIVDMALNPQFFSYMSDCSAEKNIQTGDARLKVKNLPDSSQDIIMVDAFSSDAIPVHLVTREALSLYRSKLKTDGLIFFHTSNRVMDISSVVVNLADEAGLESRIIQYMPKADSPYKKFIIPSEGVIMGTKLAIETGNLSEDWTYFKASPDVGMWTDDYSHILGTMIAHKRANGFQADSDGNPFPRNSLDKAKAGRVK